LNHQDYPVYKWRTKTSCQLLGDNVRFATLHAGCSLQMALGVYRKWEKHKGGDKHYAGQPKTAPMHEIHDLMLSPHP